MAGERSMQFQPTLYEQARAVFRRGNCALGLMQHPAAALSRKRQLLELCARIGYTPPRQ
jgi:hypothetical protein